MNEIAEIVCPSCIYGHDCLIRGKADITKCPTIKAILALIERREKPYIEALEIAQPYVRALAETTLITGFPKELLITDLAHIDSILKEQ